MGRAGNAGAERTAGEALGGWSCEAGHEEHRANGVGDQLALAAAPTMRPTQALGPPAAAGTGRRALRCAARAPVSRTRP
jgi:hypothetical protein